ncbi:MAG: hypothetical protein ACR2OI_00770 [Acidimicrobiia bacterium]
MRVFQTSAVGAALAYLALSFSQTARGFPQGASYLMAIVVATLTIGIAMAIGVHAWPEEDGTVKLQNLPAHSCHGCGSRMVEVRSAWVCGRCDRVPVG